MKKIKYIILAIIAVFSSTSFVGCFNFNNEPPAVIDVWAGSTISSVADFESLINNADYENIQKSYYVTLDNTINNEIAFFIFFASFLFLYFFDFYVNCLCTLLLQLCYLRSLRFGRDDKLLII